MAAFRDKRTALEDLNGVETSPSPARRRTSPLGALLLRWIDRRRPRKPQDGVFSPHAFRAIQSGLVNVLAAFHESAGMIAARASHFSFTTISWRIVCPTKEGINASYSY
jgi:hypothetical protein